MDKDTVVIKTDTWHCNLVMQMKTGQMPNTVLGYGFEVALSIFKVLLLISLGYICVALIVAFVTGLFLTITDTGDFDDIGAWFVLVSSFIILLAWIFWEWIEEKTKNIRTNIRNFFLKHSKKVRYE